METVKNIQDTFNVDYFLDGICKYRDIAKLLADIERNALAPKLKDQKHIPQIYEWVKELSNSESVDTLNYDPKHYFLVIVAMIYSPRIFAGFFLYRGKRLIVAETLGLSPSHISNSLRMVCEWLKYYRGFRSAINYLYSEILFRIKLNQMK